MAARIQRQHGRRRPYTELGIRRLPCTRCGRPARFQWQICADGRLFRPLCAGCDLELNEMVLQWVGIEDWPEKMEAYRRKMG